MWKICNYYYEDSEWVFNTYEEAKAQVDEYIASDLIEFGEDTSKEYSIIERR